MLFPDDISGMYGVPALEGWRCCLSRRADEREISEKDIGGAWAACLLGIGFICLLDCVNLSHLQ